MSDQVFIYPTDTVWGIGTSIFSHKGHEKVSQIKESSKEVPRSFLFSSYEMFTEFFDCPIDLELICPYEVTFLLPRDWFMKIEFVSQEIFSLSEWVGVRILTFDWILRITDKVGPIMATSLNKHGETAIVESIDARNFQKLHAREAEFVLPKNYHHSGMSSTILRFTQDHEKKLNYSFIRKGRFFDKIVKSLENLSIAGAISNS